MPSIFVKKAPAKPVQSIASVAKPPLAVVKPTPAQSKAVSAGGGLKFLKRGAQAQQIFEQEEKRYEMAMKNTIYRYWIPTGATGNSVTFLDGNIKDGVLDIPYMHEHKVMMNGKPDNFFICTVDEEPCPICEGNTPPSYVGLMTVIDHSQYKSKKDGQMKGDNVKLFVAKKDTIKLLQTYALKRGGLRGCTFDVVRVGDKSPNVGSGFDFTEKLSEKELVAKWGEKANPVNYDQYMGALYLPAKELRKMGFGSSKPAVGSEPEPTEGYDV